MDGTESGGIVIETGSPPMFSSPIKMYGNIKKHRNLVNLMVHRDFKLKYHESIIGYGWTLVEPLVMTAVFYLLFAILSTSVDPYRPLHIMIGFLTWYYFQRTIAGFTTTFQSRSGLIQVVYFPREIFLFSNVLFNAIVMIMSLLVVIPMLLYYGLLPNWRIILLPYSMLMIGLLASGIGFFTSIIQVRIKDVEHVVNLGTRIMFFLSPVFFTLETMSRVPDQFLNAYLYVNPMAVYLTMVRSSFTGIPIGIGPSHIISAFIVSVLIFYFGSIFFMRNERKAVKYL